MFAKLLSTKHRKITTQIILLLCIVVMSGEVVAQEVEMLERAKQGIGFSTGYILGSGLTYARYLGPHIIQGSFIGDVDQYKKDFKAGLSYARYVHRVDAPRSLLPAALKFIAGADVHYQEGFVDADVIYYEQPFMNQESHAYFFHTGAGLGLDVGTPGKPGIVVSLIITYALSLEKINANWEWEVSPLPAVGILYSW